MRISNYVLALVLCALSLTVKAEVLKGPQEARQLADRIMSKVGSGDVDSGLTLMKPYLIVPEVELEAQRNQAKLQWPLLSQRFGACIGQEFIREDRVGESLLRLVYIQKFERHAMRWVFIFYRNNEGWVLNTFKFDDAIQTIF